MASSPPFAPRCVLLATDGSEGAEHARGLAVDLARRYCADLHAIHVSAPSAADLAEDPTQAAEGAAPRGVPPADRTGLAMRRSSHVGQAILAYAAEVEADLIVMGTHGHRGLRRLMLGSTADFVLRRATCPVLVARPDAPATLTGGRVLVTDDLSPRAESTVAVAAALAHTLGVGLDVLHVVEPLHVPTPYGPLLIASLDLDYDAIAREAEAALHDRATEAASELDVHIEVRMGDPVDVIAARVNDAPPAVLVMGSHGSRGLDRLLLGSVAEGVVRRASCPVLVVRAGGEPEG
ncbi:MAG TPA: universal stress protein [Rhodothermales bacterium]|nr:universal stress protein [Rhodothermales bacterium]